MSDPADKNFDNPADNPYAPKSVRPVNPQGGLGTAESAFPRFLRSVDKQGGTGAENEIPASDPKLWRKSLNPEIMSSSPPSFPSSSSFTSRNPWWPITIIFAVALGTAIGVYIVDGTTWRQAFGFGTNTTEATSRLDTPKAPIQVSSPAAHLPIASAAPQPANGASLAGGLPVASPVPQPDTAQSASPPIASAAPQPTNAAPAAASPTVTAAPQPTAPAPARVATAEGSSGSAPAIRGVTNSEIRFGISAPFTGAAKELGNQMRLGIETAFDLANDTGGINSRQAKLVVADDGYEPTRTADTMK